MIQYFERLEFQSGVITFPDPIGGLPLRTVRAAKIPPELRREIYETDILNCGGVYGHMDASQPFQYDQLRLFLTYDVVEITVFNRAEALKTAPGDKLLRIDRFMAVFERVVKPKRKDAR
jgi:hypothetical protein